MATPDRRHDPIVLFDGDCNLCHAAVRFIVDRDPKGRVRFASLRSELAQELLASFGVDGAPGPAGPRQPPSVEPSEGDPGTMYLIEGGRLYDRSTAALRVTRYLNGLWPVAAAYLAVPAAIRDAVYDAIARRRFRWFGRADACRVPTADEVARFLG